ncbi:MAG: hypothetical protein LBS55_09950 [Prevotellaceae bacterium]|jgi:hypothetical protein|nr:hypothetical protein [Prevotellaceae bacterium]
MNRIEQLYQKFEQLKPVSATLQKRLEQQFSLDFNYNSDHIEGNTLTYGQTQLLLSFDKITSNVNNGIILKQDFWKNTITPDDATAAIEQIKPFLEYMTGLWGKIMEHYIQSIKEKS